MNFDMGNTFIAGQEPSPSAAGSLIESVTCT